ncbi:MAG: hypothetical protein MRZ62_00180 [Brachyspira sp.]|nr:hypothetical protein [Brachyspira sp.]
MATEKKKKFKVVFDSTPTPVDQAVKDAYITQLMVTIVRVGLRTDRISVNSDIIKKEKEHGTQEN